MPKIERFDGSSHTVLAGGKRSRSATASPVLPTIRPRYLCMCAASVTNTHSLGDTKSNNYLPRYSDRDTVQYELHCIQNRIDQRQTEFHVGEAKVDRKKKQDPLGSLGGWYGDDCAIASLSNSDQSTTTTMNP